MFKTKKSKILSTIALLVMILGVGVGVVLVQRSQDIREKAGPGGSDCAHTPNCVDRTGTSGTFKTSEFNASLVIDYFVIKAGTQDFIFENSGQQACYAVIFSGDRKEIEWRTEGESGPDCQNISHVEIYMREVVQEPTPTPTTPSEPTATPTVRPTESSEPTATPTIRPTATPTVRPTATPTVRPTATPTLPADATPTPTPSIIAKCNGIWFYDTDWNKLSKTDLTSFKEGDVVIFVTSATVNAGVVDKARFEVNGILKPETTLKRTGTNEFYYRYTIPADIHEFKVQAQLHHTTQGWF